MIISNFKNRLGMAGDFRLF